MKKIAIIYHDADFDGKLSNEVCRYHLARLYPEAAIHSYGWDYGRPVPLPIVSQQSPDVGCPTAQGDGLLEWRFWDAIYIVDLSVDELMARPELRTKIVWIDHHKSAIEKWDKGEAVDGECHPDNPVATRAQFIGCRIDGVAACRLCWQWFTFECGPHGDPRINPADRYMPVKQSFVDRKFAEPLLIRLAGEWDIWDKRDPDVEPLQYGLGSLDGERFAGLIEEQFAWNSGVNAGLLFKTISNGRLLMSYCQKQADEHARKHAHDVRFYGLNFCCLNIGAPGNSTLLRAAVKPEHDALMAWRFDGQKAYIILYHAPGKEHHDLSLIAVKYGGGGHKGACGFRMDLAKLSEILNNL